MMSWGPNAQKGALAISFDNFGEAFDVEQGVWPDDVPLGNHYTATTVLPDILEDLEKYSIPATFFVEGWNAEVNPNSLKAMQSAGHEVALHGWRHELWFAQTASERADILGRSVAAMNSIGISPIGFRPPGGLVTEDTSDLLRNVGIRYVSAAGEGVTGADKTTAVPFRWIDVDALYLEPQLGIVRENIFRSDELLSLADWRAALEKVADEAKAGGVCYTLIFHPYLLGMENERYEVFVTFLDRLSKMEDIWLASCAEVADWARANKI